MLTTVKFNDTKYTFNTSTTLYEELKRLKAEGRDPLKELGGVLVAHIHDGMLGVDDQGNATIGEIYDWQGVIDFKTNMGTGQNANISTIGRVSLANCKRDSYESGEDFYLEASYFQKRPRLGAPGRIRRMIDVLAEGVSPEEIAEGYLIGLATPEAPEEAVGLHAFPLGSKPLVGVDSAHFHETVAHGVGGTLRVRDWNIAHFNGTACEYVNTTAGYSQCDWVVLLKPKRPVGGDYITHMPLSEMTLGDAKAMMDSIGMHNSFNVYIGDSEDSLSPAVVCKYDDDAPGANYSSLADFYTTMGISLEFDRAVIGVLAAVFSCEQALATIGSSIWFDAKTIREHAPKYYYEPEGRVGGKVEVGSRIAMSGAVLNVIDVTDKYIIARHASRAGASVALPLETDGTYELIGK